MPCSGEKYVTGRREEEKKERKRECEEVEKGKQKEVEWIIKRQRDRETEWKGQSPFLWWPWPKAGPKLYLQRLSLWRQLLTSAPAQGNPKFHLGKKWRKRNKRNQRFCCQKSKKKEKKKKETWSGSGMGVGGYSERDWKHKSMTASSHSSIALTCDCTENKAKSLRRRAV